ncbi:sensor histidine kinase [Chitinophaga pinensis]|uniref:histidine kinase n=1 Tax=Chitinophaga pinensis (strain ATCC 43595 / DSM 2588 / LMG 13176 / NBRC 15968 / NCIMB 11800 / UQM 2034) TaxID=485918 RepID=A0A979G6M0_CHIPD|nr:ATP-binding protein [Chitinophaga pinensis]ACU61786.1 PAS/PAC sensor signal transduction histidine kinase [Chitinophaga pinensis DSM 2588]
MDNHINLNNDLLEELAETRRRLAEAEETIEAIRTGQVDALVVQQGGTHQLYTLQTADHAYRMFIEKMNEGAVTLNRDGVILYANSRFSDMLALPLMYIIGQPLSTFVAPHSRSIYMDLYESCWKEDTKGEVDLLRHASFVPTKLSLNRLELASEMSMNIILTDLSEQKNTQRILEENNRQLEQLNSTLESSNHDLQQFASVASHDLQEPLRKIQMFGNFLKTAGVLQPAGKEYQYLEKILKSAERMKTLIIDVLNYSRLSINTGEFLPVALDELVQEILEDFELLIKEKDAQISVAKLPVLDVNKGQIRQMFQNLISNALKFSNPGIRPVIKIGGCFLADKNFDSPESPEGSYYMVSVEDNGIGFEEKYIPNIFALFERLNSKEAFEGTGIGLAIAKKIVEKHNGVIHVKSKVRCGSRFQIIIPVTHSIS